ncbi:MAG: crossover junction endodeoxyribonuclease RuvC [Pseudomonadota bacterium]
MNETIRILGVDPGLRRTGWGVVERAGTRLSYVACGALAIAADRPLADRLCDILRGLEEIIAAHGPAEAAVEKTFVNANPASALVLGQARGAALLAPALAGLPVAEYAPNEVKKSVVGVGHADKAPIKAMVGVLLPAARPGSADAADALAIAICHAHARQARALRLRASA